MQIIKKKVKRETTIVKKYPIRKESEHSKKKETINTFVY